MKKFNLFKMLAVLIVLITSINTAWGWTAIYFHGDFTGEWDGASYQINYELDESNSGHYFYPFYNGSTGDKYWRLYAQKDYVNWQLSPSSNNYVQNVGTAGYKVTNYKDWKNYNFKTTNASKGVLAVHINQGDGNGDLTPGTWLEKPTIYIWHNWDGNTSGWGNNGGAGQKAMTNNNDGTYSYDGVYSASGTNVGIEGSGAIKKYFADNNTDICTKVGSPSSGDKCRFTWNSEGYRGYNTENDNTGSLTITKLYTVTYDDNYSTSGTAPEAQDVPHGSSVTLRDNSGSLTKDDFVFVGWNTERDGSGYHYDVRHTIDNVTGNITLYAEWVSGKWMVRGKGGDGAMGSDFETSYVLRKVSDDEYKGTVTLGAHQVYEFKVTDGKGTWYSKNFNSGSSFVYVGQTGAMELYSDVANNCRIATGNAGNYTFEFNENTHFLSITYPNGSAHPSTNYVYYSNPNSWTLVKGHVFNISSDEDKLTSWDDSPELNSVTIGGGTYYFVALGNYNRAIFRGHENNNWGQSINLNNASSNYGKYYSNANPEAWNPFTVRITLNNHGATTTGDTYKDITFNDGTLTTSITCPTKDGYNFGGYYTGEDGSGVMIINSSGVWQESVDGYTDGSKKWILDGGSTTLHAKWIEKTWSVTATVSPSGTGFATPSEATSYGEVTGGAIMASNYTGYHFTTWSITSGSGSFTSAVTTANNTFKPTSASTLCATFAVNIYTDDNNLDKNGGTSHGKYTATYETTSIDINTPPTYTGYTIDGYYGDADKTIYVADALGNLQASKNVGDYAVTDENSKWKRDANITLYTKWKCDAPSVSCTDNVVTITAPAGSTVRYTTDGSTTPTTSTGTEYSGTFTIEENTTVKAVAYRTGYTTSDVRTYDATYTPVYTVTHNPTHASKSSGETSILENKAYTAVYEEVTGYDLPNNITVTVGGELLTAGDDYTWTKATGTLNILANKITGNVVITVTGEPSTYDGTIEGNEGSDGGYTATYDLTSIDITTEPERLGFDVEGYYIDEDLVYRIAYPNGSLVESSYKNTTPIVADHKWMYTGNVPAIGEAPTIYTKWIAHKYTVYLDQEGGSGGSEYFKVEMNTANYEFGDGKDATMTLPSKTGYDFTGYYTAASDGTQVFDEYGNAINNTTGYVGANAKWVCTTDNITLHAQWEAKTYDITLNDRGATTAGTDAVTATYDSKDLSSAISNPTKWGSTFGGWAVNSNGTGNIVIGTDGKLVEEEVDGYTDASGNWKRDGNVDLYAVWTPNEHLYWIPGANSSDKDGDADGAIEFTSAGDGKYYVTIDTDEDDVFHLGDGENAGGPSSNTNFTLATSSCGLNSNANTFTYNGDTKQTVVYVLDLNAVTLDFEHLVIYKPGEDEYDLHTAIGAVDGFSGTIYGQFEYRQRVDGINKWSTLYLPYKPTLVQAWGGTSYHNLYPCHRPVADDPLYQGYYVIRTPGQTTNLPIKDFKQWNDPTSYSSWTPEANTPYIIMWQLDWFRGKYISFWGNGGDTGVTFGSSFVPGAAPTADGVVNVLGNGTMVTGYVEGAYVLSDEYGDGAWLRGAEVTDESTVGPFECYIRANGTTTANTLVIKRRTGDDTTTGWDEILNYETKEVITVYTISGLRVAQYKDCSFEEAGRRMNAELSEGIYIMNAGNESVKLIIR